jgi:hypothetical protein
MESGAEVIAIIIYSLVINLETECGETKIVRNLAYISKATVSKGYGMEG